MSLKEFAETLPEYAKDLRLNVGSLLSDQTLGDQRKYGLLLACAHGTGYRPIVEAAFEKLHEAREDISPATMERHRGIVSLMEELEAVDWYDQRIDAAALLGDPARLPGIGEEPEQDAPDVEAVEADAESTSTEDAAGED